MATLLLLSLTFLSLLSLSSSIPSQTILSAVEILSNSGYVSMALTLELASPQTPIPQSPSATIFSPPDAAFIEYGQPSLPLLQFHFSPRAFSREILNSLPFGSKIPTMFPNHSLIVTTPTSDDQISLNNVTINGSPIFDDGYLIIFGIEDFFDPGFDFQVSSPPPIQTPSPNPGCIGSSTNNIMNSSGAYSFHDACGALRSKGYSVMASFLDLQLKGFKDETKLTVFAPVDETMVKNIGNYSEYSSLFLRHIIPCKLLWADLVNFDDGSMLPTYLEGFTINITRSGGTLMLNGVAVTFPDMYYSNWLVVHGLHEILTLPERPEQVGDSSSGNEGSDNKKTEPHLGEF